MLATSLKLQKYFWTFFADVRLFVFILQAFRCLHSFYQKRSVNDMISRPSAIPRLALIFLTTLKESKVCHLTNRAHNQCHTSLDGLRKFSSSGNNLRQKKGQKTPWRMIRSPLSMEPETEDTDTEPLPKRRRTKRNISTQLASSINIIMLMGF